MQNIPQILVLGVWEQQFRGTITMQTRGFIFNKCARKRPSQINRQAFQKKNPEGSDMMTLDSEMVRLNADFTAYWEVESTIHRWKWNADPQDHLVQLKA